MDKKAFPQYWVTVAKRARQEASKAVGCFGRFLTFGVSFMVALLLALAGVIPTTAIVTAFSTAVILLIIWFLFFIIKVTQQPVIIHNEQVDKINDLHAKLEAINDRQPKLVIDRVYKEPRHLLQGQAYVEFFHISLANHPKIRTEQTTARKVIAQLTYYDDQKLLMEPIYGRWSGTQQPSTRSPLISSRDLLAVDLEANGLPHELTIALKHTSDDVLYAFNNDSYFGYPDFRKPEFLINEKQIYVKVYLTGENVNGVDFWLLLKQTQASWVITLAEPRNLP